MEEHNILIIANRSEFRAWHEAHHASERECWVDVKRGRPVDDQHFWYLDAVEEALCFGWIDSRQYTQKDGKGKANVFANAIKHDFKSKNPTTRWSDIIKLK